MQLQPDIADEAMQRRHNFYLSLATYSSHQLGAQEMFNTCATTQPMQEETAVDAAIRAYSKLIINLIIFSRSPHLDEHQRSMLENQANGVVEFLKTGYNVERMRSQEYIDNKNRILLLFVHDIFLQGDSIPLTGGRFLRGALINNRCAVLHSLQIYQQMKDLLIYKFSIDRSDEIIKCLIIYLVAQRQMSYDSMTPSQKAHIFAYILNTPAMFEYVNMYDENTRDEILMDIDQSPDMISVLQTAEYPLASHISQMARGVATGGKKRTLRNNNSKSYSKKIKNKNKNNKKTRRSRLAKSKIK
jgi:hypothetical protein